MKTFRLIIFILVSGVPLLLSSQTDSTNLFYRYAYAPQQHQVGLGFAGSHSFSTQPGSIHRDLMAQLSYGYFFRYNWMVGLRASYWYRHSDMFRLPEGTFWQGGPFLRYYANFIEKKVAFFPELGYQIGSFYHPNTLVSNSHNQEGIFSYFTLGVGLAWRPFPLWEGDMVIQRVRPLGCVTCAPSIEGHLSVKHYFGSQDEYPFRATFWDHRTSPYEYSSKRTFYTGTTWKGNYWPGQYVRPQNTFIQGVLGFKGGYFFKDGWSLGVEGRFFYRYYSQPQVALDRDGLFWQLAPYLRRHIQVADYRLFVNLEAKYAMGSYYFVGFTDTPHLAQGLTHMAYLGVGAEIRPTRRWGYGFMLRSQRVLNCGECLGAEADWVAALAGGLTLRWEVNRYF